MLPNCVRLYERLWSARGSLLLRGQWAAVGKPDHFSCLLIFIIFFFTSVEIMWYIANVCYPTSITPRSTPVPPATAMRLCGPVHSHCRRICPCRHCPRTAARCPVFISCWLFWAANLQIMAYRMPVYQNYFMLQLIPPIWNLYICIETLWSYPLFLLFSSKTIH